jgi:electron transfer flavoprotein beta subunit
VRKAAAMGADGVIHVQGPDETLPESRRTAKLLAAAVRTVPFDLIWCGRKATDDDAAQVGPMVAELLGIPHVGPALAAELSEDRKWVVATRDSEIGQERVRCPLPVLLTAQKGLNEPRVPTIQGVMRGMKLQPTKISPEELALPEGGPSGWKLVGLSEPPRRPPVRILEGSDAASKARELVRILKEEVKVL